MSTAVSSLTTDQTPTLLTDMMANMMHLRAGVNVRVKSPSRFEEQKGIIPVFY